MRWSIWLGVLMIAACARVPHSDPVTVKKQNLYGEVLRSNMEAYVGDLQSSINDLKKGIEKNPGSAYLHYSLAERYAENQKLEEAVLELDVALKLRPDWTPAQFLLARLYQAQKDHVKARSLLEQIVRREPNHVEVQLQLAIETAELGQLDLSVARLRRLIEKEPQAIMAYYYLGSIQAGYLKKPQEALKTYQKILEWEPGNLQVRMAIAQIYLDAGKLPEALEQLLEIESQNATDLSVQLQIAQIYYELGKPDEAIARFEKILAVNPSADRIRYYLGLLYEKKPDPDRAIAQWQAIPSGSALYKDAQLHTAFLLRQKKEMKEAIDRLNRAIVLQPAISEFYEFLSLLWEESDNIDKAASTLKRGISELPKSERLYFNLGVLYDKYLKKKEESLAMMREVLKINPDNASALNYIGYTYAEQGVRLDEALSLVEKAVALKPADGFILDSLGWVWFQKGDLIKAQQYLEKALKLSPEEPAVNEHLGDLYLKKNNRTKALYYYRRADEFGKKSAEQSREETQRVEKKILDLAP